VKKSKKLRSWKYKNITFVIVGLILGIFLSRFEVFHSFLLNLGELGYLGAFIAGILFVSTFTVATGAVILLVLAETLSPLEIGLVAGLGAVIGDVTIFHLVKDNLATEITEIYNHIDRKNHLKKVLYSKYFSWTLPVFGSLIIASPLPDELGVSLMGLSRTNTFKFVVISYILNSIGIFMIVSASVVIKP
jgi:hypothetical protein